MPRCKAPEILRNEAYLDVRRNDEGLGKRSRWAFFSNLLEIRGKKGSDPHQLEESDETRKNDEREAEVSEAVTGSAPGIPSA